MNADFAAIRESCGRKEAQNAQRRKLNLCLLSLFAAKEIA